ncbi:MAG: hypothetical protein K2X27_18415, partial [Candidatus Obscuribacterales bacterium]|nr:hypothetical protein [Candidatus Obscuribacterales bacterium]
MGNSGVPFYGTAVFSAEVLCRQVHFLNAPACLRNSYIQKISSLLMGTSDWLGGEIHMANLRETNGELA